MDAPHCPLAGRQLSSLRERQFGQFSQSVEIRAAKAFQGKAGVRSLFSFLRSRYGTSAQAKLQLALLFSIISLKNQPPIWITRSGQADGGVVTAAEVLDGGGARARRDASDQRSDARQQPAARGRGAELAPTGQLASIIFEQRRQRLLLASSRR